METTTINLKSDISTLIKSPTGIAGLDDVLGGGLPQGRISLVCGGPGSGKTLLATEFLVNGAEKYNEPGVFIAFEETQEDLAKNVASLGINLDELIESNKIFVDFVYIERSEIEETGEFDLEGLFIRLASAIDSIGAKRVVLDTIETIFAGFPNEAILRSEIRRLFRWLKQKGVTAIVTGERGDNSLTRYGLEEYVSDCVILLENRVINKMANRILRVVKYRGSHHGADEFPFLIGKEGIWVQPITSIGLVHEASNEFISTGIPKLDEMIASGGYFRGSSILVTGTAGTGKTSLAASLVNGACQSGERCLFIAFEESTSQILRNMCSIGLNLQQWVEKGLLHFHAVRPTFYSLEMHLLLLEKMIDEYKPSVFIMDPLTNLVTAGSGTEAKSMLIRLIDFLKTRKITAMFTSLVDESSGSINQEIGTSSLMDTWLLLRNIEQNGERNRGLYILKSRGQAHSNLVREFVLTSNGIDLVDVYIGPEGILTGSARKAQEMRERLNIEKQGLENERRHRELLRKRRSIQSQIDSLQAELEAEEAIFKEEMSAKAEEQTRIQAEHRAEASAKQFKGNSGSKANKKR